MPKVVIQAGHQNCKNNIVPELRGSSGAPGEMSFNIDIANQVSAQLRARGFEVKQTDSNANSDQDILDKDWDLFLAIHYDADVYKDDGGFIDIPQEDCAAAESKRIAQSIRDTYFSTTGIKNMPNRSNPNSFNYYMWSALSKKTPCVLIECGVGWRVPKDSDVLNSVAGRPRVVEGIVKGICKAFNVPYETSQPTPVPTPTPLPGTTPPVTPPESSLNQKAKVLIGEIEQKLAELKKLFP